MRTLVRIALIVSVVSLAACADDSSDNNANSGMDMGTAEEDMGEIEEDMGGTEEDMSANNSSMPDMDYGPCAPDEYLVTTDDSCAACPGTEFTCEGVLPNVTLDETTNIVTVTFDPTMAEVVEATWSGTRSEGDGMSVQTLPLSIDGTIEGDTMRFNLQPEEEGDELQLGRLRIVDGCEETFAFSLIVRWEPGGAVTAEPTCL